MDPRLLSIVAAFGLSAATGLNTFLTLLLIGVLARLGLLSLSHPYDALTSDVALISLAVLGLLEVVADKVPGLDSVVQAIQTPLAMAAGAIAFASQQHVVTQVAPGLAILIGVLTAGSVHIARVLLRPLVTASSGCSANPIVSTVEDIIAVVLTVTASTAPDLLPVFFLVFILFLVALVWLALKVARWLALLLGKAFKATKRSLLRLS